MTWLLKKPLSSFKFQFESYNFHHFILSFFIHFSLCGTAKHVLRDPNFCVWLTRCLFHILTIEHLTFQDVFPIMKFFNLSREKLSFILQNQKGMYCGWAQIDKLHLSMWIVNCECDAVKFKSPSVLCYEIVIKCLFKIMIGLLSKQFKTRVKMAATDYVAQILDHIAQKLLCLKFLRINL